ncbi:hypothetical protein [Paraburkholderia acidisoli]|uniref:Uncharacterized protein n=1 Tax=Paraburkholderia acidisoli TaxID=2571748 RepID=A0A7Z2GH24_9BURK|nr:hypothetical protein [Paraburkholderia acidisoli]QGZ61677.1 hypothetical protein FAZ98_07975 [Paraburkholderia acidisoli]
MHTETLGHYEVELSARQLIHNGGWAAFAAIHARAEPTDDGASTPFSREWRVDETVFASEAAAIEGARVAALAFLKSGNAFVV